MLELLLSQTFNPGTKNVMELLFPGLKISWNYHSLQQESWDLYTHRNEKIVKLLLSISNTDRINNKAY